MGQDCDIMVAKHKVGRKEQDEFAKRSHDLAEEAWKKWFPRKRSDSVEIEPDFKMIREIMELEAEHQLKN